MRLINKISQGEVFSHFERVEKISITQRLDIVFPLLAYALDWYLAEVENSDIERIYICSSDDWLTDGLCVPDFRLITAIENYKKSDFSTGKFADIKTKEDIFRKDIKGLDTKLILVSDNPPGPFTLIEGCKRSVALGNIEKLVGREVYIGISPSINTYIWARHMYEHINQNNR